MRLKAVDGHLYRVSAVARDYHLQSGGGKRNEMTVISKTERSPFIIEGLSPDTGVSNFNCDPSDHPDLKPDRCQGEIQLKKIVRKNLY